jgi:hypothetical protein
MLEIAKHAAQLKAIGFPDSPETLLQFMTDDELDVIEKTVTAIGIARPPDRSSELERVGEIVRVAYRRMEMRHPGVE